RIGGASVVESGVGERVDRAPSRAVSAAPFYSPGGNLRRAPFTAAPTCLVLGDGAVEGIVRNEGLPRERQRGEGSEPSRQPARRRANEYDCRRSSLPAPASESRMRASTILAVTAILAAPHVVTAQSPPDTT